MRPVSQETDPWKQAMNKAALRLSDDEIPQPESKPGEPFVNTGIVSAVRWTP